MEGILSLVQEMREKVYEKEGVSLPGLLWPGSSPGSTQTYKDFAKGCCAYPTAKSGIKSDAT